MINEPEILFEDDLIVAAVKPFGATSESGPFTDSVKTAAHCPSLYSVHRLDKACGGLIIYAKDPASAAKFSSLFAGNGIVKTYLAVTERAPEAEHGRLDDLLFHDAAKNKTYVVDRIRKGVKQASLEYRLLQKAQADSGELALISVHLLTGRTHQIRVQFASRGLPLYGDARYGASNRRKEVALWSCRMSFRHPVTGEPVGITSLPPETEPWNLFREIQI